ncbi:MAG: hypothetical protein AB1595_06135 [bacterium]
MDVIAAVGFIATFLGVCIAISAYFNGKHIKEGVKEISAILERMDKRAEESHKEALMLSEERQREVLNLFGKMNERIEEGHKEFLQLFGTLFKRIPAS